MFKKHETVSIDELNRIVAERNQKEVLIAQGKSPEVDHIREERMQELREAHPEGLRARPRSRGRKKRVTTKWDTVDTNI